ncbi:HNH endonuclease signature motif containing protein [Rhabdothermincola sp.]|uniref:HNH endonuclease signature motif containing protein n=1 Tax=Rhabdothermincola sp. TaxID=2820405 RepID=UPI002FE0A481
MFDWVGLAETGRKLAALDASLADDEALLEGVQALEELRRALDAAEGHLLAELERRGVCDREFGSGTAGWLAREAMLPAAVAKARVGVGLALRASFGRVDEALVDGRVSWEHAQALVRAANPRVLDGLAGLQEELVGLAAGTTFERWRRELAGVVALLDQDGGHDPAEDVEENRLSMVRTFDGVHHLAGTLVGEHALVAKQALEAEADELFRRYRRDQEHCPELEVPPRSTLLALALVELCRRGRATDARTSRPPRPEVTLVVNALDPTSGACSTDGVILADGSVRTLLCDPELYPVVVDSLGVPLDLGRAVRYATVAQRRALALRDGGCVFPGCDAPISWCDAHHLDEHRHGGHTNLDRLVALCRHHHGVTHRRGWRVHTTADGWHWWQTPTGRTFWSQRHGRQRAAPAPPPI